MSATEVDDTDLGARVRAGDDEAFAELYQRYLPRLYDFAARLLRDPGAAEDLVQSTFIRAYEHRETLRDPAKVRSWLFTTAHNLAMNQIERRRPAEPVEERRDLADPGPGPEAEAETREAADLVWAAAAGLEPRQYAVLDMSVRQELTTPEIAEVLGLPATHAAVLVNRARDALGNAVRFLMVARRRDHCAKLAELVPTGVRELSPEQRSTVDYHMRHCEDCQVMARRLTMPAELFGELAPVPVPAELALWQGWPARPATGGRGRGSRRRRPGKGLPHAIAGMPALAVVVAGAIAIGGAGTVLLVRGLGQHGGTASLPQGSSSPHANPTPTPSPSPDLTACTSPLPGTAAQLTVCPLAVTPARTFTVRSVTACTPPTRPPGFGGFGFGVVIDLVGPVHVNGAATVPDAQGSWSGTIAVPANAPIGQYRVEAQCSRFSTGIPGGSNNTFAYAPVAVQVIKGP